VYPGDREYTTSLDWCGIERGDPSPPWCWSCGRGEREKPTNWHAPWFLQNAHLAAGSGKCRRVEEPWFVCRLCPLCHACHRHHEAMVRINGEELPAITDANMLWLKRERDPWFWHPQAIAKEWIGVPPEPTAPHEFYLNQYAQRRGT
jgi:hypothetical protein